MLKHLEGAKLGLFIFLGTVLLVIAIFLLGSKDSLFSDNILVKSYFDNVEGLRTGAAVRLNGLSVGSVSDVRLLDLNQYRVEVTMRINRDVQQFIRLDSEAAIETEGIIGSKIVVITPGSKENAIVNDGGTIVSQSAVNMNQIIAETQDIMTYMKELTKELAQVLGKVNKGEGTIGKLVNDEQLYFEAVNIVQSADTSLNIMVNRLERMSGFIIGLGSSVEGIIGNVDSAAIDLRNLIASIEGGEGALGALIADESVYDSIKTVVHNLTQTTYSAKIGTEAFAENMEALKHNWLFKKYFEERGYWSKTEYEEKLNAQIAEIEKSKKELDERLNRLEELEKKLTNEDN
ncbi:MAG: MlaD family protein [Melioribacteraceae bacterium]|nr:MlaD family protein [Melioribacteraceae bacterium]